MARNSFPGLIYRGGLPGAFLVFGICFHIALISFIELSPWAGAIPGPRPNILFHE